MKLVLALFLGLSSSMTRAPSELIKIHSCIPQSEISCIVENTMVCPPGYLDGCISGETITHECIIHDTGPSCDIPLKLNCPVNFKDACMTEELETHQCVPVEGQLCTQQEKISCPSGFVDSCRQ